MGLTLQEKERMLLELIDTYEQMIDGNLTKIGKLNEQIEGLKEANTNNLRKMRELQDKLREVRGK